MKQVESDAKTEVSMVTDTFMSEIAEKDKEIDKLKFEVEKSSNALASTRADL